MRVAENGREDHSIVLIDGVCHLCQAAVRFIIPRDPQGHFRFVVLQSGVGRELLEAGGMPSEGLNTVVLVENGVYYTESAAALRIVRRLRYPWPLAYAFILVPRPLRDAVYRVVARNRYRWFGRDEACLIPTPDIKRRFLQ